MPQISDFSWLGLSFQMLLTFSFLMIFISGCNFLKLNSSYPSSLFYFYII